MANGSTRKGARGPRSSGKRTATQSKTGVATTDARLRKPAALTRTIGRVATGKTLTPRRSDGTGRVGKPFYSDAMQAYIIEYVEPDAKVPGGRWESRVYCESEATARDMYVCLASVTTRDEWCREGHVAAKQLLAENGRHFLYRTLMGERAEKML